VARLLAHAANPVGIALKDEEREGQSSVWVFIVPSLISVSWRRDTRRHSFDISKFLAFFLFAFIFRILCRGWCYGVSLRRVNDDVRVTLAPCQVQTVLVTVAKMAVVLNRREDVGRDMTFSEVRVLVVVNLTHSILKLLFVDVALVCDLLAIDHFSFGLNHVLLVVLDFNSIALVVAHIRHDLVFESKTGHVFRHAVAVPHKDVFLEKLHTLSPWRNVKHHEEDKGERDEDRN
jgi:hypothetical protein